MSNFKTGELVVATNTQLSVIRGCKGKILEEVRGVFPVQAYAVALDGLAEWGNPWVLFDWELESAESERIEA